MFNRINGWLNLFKPRGISSAQLISIIKKYLPKKIKIGHSGTLDLEAEGVLPLAIGEATKLIRVLVESKKTYIFKIQFGAQTNTGDFSGTIIKTTNIIPTKKSCIDICLKFLGIKDQTPHAFSALKINGIRSYLFARNNISIPLKSRKITIFQLKCLDFCEYKKQATFEVECSKGTYIRTLAEDIALSLQSLGFVLELVRTKVGLFLIENAIKLSDFTNQNHESINFFLLKKKLEIEAVLDDILVFDLTLEQMKQVYYGQKFPIQEIDNEKLIWLRFDNRLVAIGEVINNYFCSLRVFNLSTCFC